MLCWQDFFPLTIEQIQVLSLPDSATAGLPGDAGHIVGLRRLSPQPHLLVASHV